MLNETQLRLGEILIEAEILTKEQLDQALVIQEKRQLRFGTILLQEGFVSETQLVQALSRRLSIPWVSLWHIDIKDELLNLVPVNVAEEFFLIPIYIRKTPGGDRALYVAMNDPTDSAALRFVAASSGLTVRPMIAGPSDISAAIRAYYYEEADDFVEDNGPSVPIRLPATGGPSYQSDKVVSEKKTQEKRKSVPPLPPIPEAAKGTGSANTVPQGVSDITDIAEEIVDTDLEEEKTAELVAVDAPTDTTDTDAETTPTDSVSKEEKQRVQREVEKHMFGVRPAKSSKGIALTLLDGTQIRFGGGVSSSESQEALTREELIRILKAADGGSPIAGQLPTDKWEGHVGAMLEILFRKHLIFFEEYMEELKKR
jgi:hypothetical protein